jgi:hypothetical protein
MFGQDSGRLKKKIWPFGLVHIYKYIKVSLEKDSSRADIGLGRTLSSDPGGVRLG